VFGPLHTLDLGGWERVTGTAFAVDGDWTAM